MTRCIVFFFNDTATTEIYPLSLHDALPISRQLAVDLPADLLGQAAGVELLAQVLDVGLVGVLLAELLLDGLQLLRSEEHTSELQSRQYLVCRLLLEKQTHTPYVFTTSLRAL